VAAKSRRDSSGKREIKKSEIMSNEILSIQDIAMFIGCQAVTTKPGYVNPKPGTISDVDFLMEEITIDSEHGYYLCQPEHVKLFLRPMSSMTEDEMKELYFLVFKRSFVGSNITHRDIGKKEERHVLWSGIERLFIYKDGDIGADCDLHHHPVHQPTVIKWMISKQFDIFGWIEKGLAISKTKEL
jgi:hypothetical protein